MDQENKTPMGEDNQENFEDKILRIIKAGIGAVAETVEKSKDAISDFASKENVHNLANKGEQTLEQVKTFGAGAIEKVKKTWSEADIMGMVKSKSEKLRKLAQEVHELPDAEREAFNDLLAHMDKHGVSQEDAQEDVEDKEATDARQGGDPHEEPPQS